jgi:putative ABC transport system ATP-binding protein
MAAALSLSGPAARPLVELADVSKDYDTGGGLVRAMRDVSLSIAQGEFVAIVGTSGSGKSTMMNILGCLDRPTRGSYTLAGIDVGDREGDSRAIVRNRVIGFIFQGFNLLPRTTALENVELPLQYRGVGLRERRRRALAALGAVGLSDRIDHNPSQLSGGQQQRVAIARALVTDPPLLLADEPTGNLDTRTSLEVLALLQRLNRDRGITIVLVTHERDIAACAGRVVTMRDGKIVGDVVQDAPMDAATEIAALGSPSESLEGAGSTAADASDAAGKSSGARAPISAYPIMAVASLGGAVVGWLWVREVLNASVANMALVPWLASEVASAWAGARWVRSRIGRPPTSDLRAALALRYTVGLSVAGVAVVALCSHFVTRGSFATTLDAAAAFVDRGALFVAVVALCGIGVLTLLRYLLLTAFNPRQ